MGSDPKHNRHGSRVTTGAIQVVTVSTATASYAPSSSLKFSSSSLFISFTASLLQRILPEYWEKPRSPASAADAAAAAAVVVAVIAVAFIPRHPVRYFMTQRQFRDLFFLLKRETKEEWGGGERGS